MFHDEENGDYTYFDSWEEYSGVRGPGGGGFEDPPLYTFRETFEYIDIPEFGGLPGFERESVIGTLDASDEDLYTQPAQDWWNPLFGIEYPVSGPEGEFGQDPTAPAARPRSTSGGGGSSGGGSPISGGQPKPTATKPTDAAPPGKSSLWPLAAVAALAYLLAKERK